MDRGPPSTVATLFPPPSARATLGAVHSNPSVSWWEQLRRHWWWAPAYFGCWTLVALAFAGQHFLTSAKIDRPVAWAESVCGALADWYTFAVFSLPAIHLAWRFNLAGAHWRLRLTLHLVASMVFSLIWILVRAGLAGILPGRGSERPLGEILQNVIVATFFFNVLIYWVVVTVTHAVAYASGLRERERRLLELEGRLSSARLHALQMQLNPHFLFNALNGIATLMYRDVERADAMLMKLAGLLRHVVDRGPETQVRLREEIDFLDRYLALEQMRFGDRIQIRRELDPATLDALVPNLLLQPLVENAIKHGLEPLPKGGVVTLRSSRSQDGRLRLEVGDNGAGLAPGATAEGGVGTANVRIRLRQLYGKASSIVFGAPPEGGSGLWITILLPWETSAHSGPKNRASRSEDLPVSANNHL